MRILVLSQYFWPENFRINEVAKTLSEKGVAVEVLTGKPNYPRGKILDGYRWKGCQFEMMSGIGIHRVPIIARGQGGWRLAVNYLSFLLSGSIFGPLMLRGKKFDLIFVHGVSPILQAIPAILLGRLKGCPVVLWVQDLWPESVSAAGYLNNPYALKFVEYVVRFIYRKVNLLLVQSEAFVGPVSAMASGTPVKYYPNSVEADFASQSPISIPDFPWIAGKFSVMFAGNLGIAQALSVIVDAASLLKEHSQIEFVVVGDGSRRDWMLEEVKKRDLKNLRLPGRFPLETMPGLMQKASVLLVTLTDHPIFAMTVPNKVQAYMAAGRPIIACLRGEGARLVVAARAGLVALPEDPVALADAVRKLFEMSHDEREGMGERGRSYYRTHFNHDLLMEKLIECFEDMLKSRAEGNS